MDRFGTLAFGYDGKNPLVNRKELEEHGVYEDAAAIQAPSTTGHEDRNEDIHTQALLEAFKKVWDIEDLRYTPIKNRTLAAWHLYHMTYEKNIDADQSDKRYPAAMMLVERIASQFMRMIDSTPNWFQPVALIPQQQVLYNLVKRFVRCITDKRDNQNHEFWAMIEEAFKSGIISGQLVAQIVPMEDDQKLLVKKSEQDTEWFDMLSILNTFVDNPDKKGSKPFIPNPSIPRLSLSTLPAENFLLDSTNHGRYRMWTQLVPVATVFDQAEAKGYDIEALRRAKQKRAGGISDSNKYTLYTREGMGVDTNPPEGMIRLHFFEGTLHDPVRGAVLFTNKIMVMANGCEIVLPPTEIPFWDGGFSTIHGKFISPPHSVYGKGLLSENADNLDVKNDVINRLLDWVRAVLNPGYEEDQDKLDEEELRNPRGMFPGRIVRTRDTNGQPVYRTITPGELPQSFWNVFQVLDSYSQTSDGTNGMMAGGTRTRGRITADEFNTRQADSSTLFWGIFQGLERWLAEVLRVYFLRTLQYTPDRVWSDWVKIEAKALIPPGTAPEIAAQWNKMFETVAGWDAETRYRLLGGHFSFSVKVFSALAERQAEIEKITFMLRQLGTVPGAVQTLQLAKVMLKMVEAFGWDPEEVMNPNVIPIPDTDLLPPSPTDTGGGVPEDDSLDLSDGAMQALTMGAAPMMPPNQPAPIPGGPRQPSVNPPHPVVE